MKLSLFRRPCKTFKLNKLITIIRYAIFSSPFSRCEHRGKIYSQRLKEEDILELKQNLLSMFSSHLCSVCPLWKNREEATPIIRPSTGRTTKEDLPQRTGSWRFWRRTHLQRATWLFSPSPCFSQREVESLSHLSARKVFQGNFRPCCVYARVLWVKCSKVWHPPGKSKRQRWAIQLFS